MLAGFQIGVFAGYEMLVCAGAQQMAY